MAIRQIVTRGYSTGLNDADVNDIIVRGYSAGVVPPAPPVTEPAGGGRRIKKREYRPLSRRERDELDRLFRANAKPRYVAPPEPVRVTKRTAPIVITTVPDELPPITKPAQRIVAAKQFLALDAIESLLDALPTPSLTELRAHARAQQHAQWLAQEQERIALAAIAEAERVAVEQARLAAEAEADLLMVLLIVHDGIGA